MSATTGHMSLFDRLHDEVLGAIEGGASIEDAATQSGTAASTVKGWLRRGRDGITKYRHFAARVDAAFTERKLPSNTDRPADRAELLLLASRAARAGNVQAMRLLGDLLNPEEGGNADELTEFDELAQRRAR